MVVGVAAAAVRVDDTSGCVAAETLELELGAHLGEAALARIDVNVVRDGDALALEVLDRGESLWQRRLDVGAEDCPAAADLVVRSVAQALDAIPGWTVAVGRPAPDAWVDAGAGFGPQAPPRWDARVGMSIAVNGRLRAQVGADLAFSPVRAAPAIGGDAWLAGARGGGVVEVGARRRTRCEAAGVVGGGWIRPRPRELVADVGWLPSVAGEVGCTRMIAEPVRLGVALRVPVNRITIRWSELEGAEPPAWVVVRLGVGGALR